MGHHRPGYPSSAQNHPTVRHQTGELGETGRCGRRGDHRDGTKPSARRSFPLLLPLLLTSSAPLGEGQGPQSGQSDLLATRAAAAIRAGLVPPDRRIDLGQELLLLLNHREGETSLWRRAPSVRAWRVPRLELLLPLGQRPANPGDQRLAPLSKKAQELRSSGMAIPSALTCHAEPSPERSRWPCPQRERRGGEASRSPHQPTLKSSHFGLTDSIRAIFFARNHPLICFSRASAA